MKERSKELQARIDARDTELQRAYDMAIENVAILTERKGKVLSDLRTVEKQLSDEFKQIQLCKRRAQEQEALDIL